MSVNSIAVESHAPGRLDVMGGIADYSGSLVLQMPIRQETHIRISLRDDFVCAVKSETGDKIVSASVDYKGLLLHNEVDYAYACNQLKKKPDDAWIAYIVGCALVLQKEKNIPFQGADFVVRSDVPLGKGVSSSASLEVATMSALANAFHLSFDGTELPVLAQRVENLVVGAPCGLMDQLASYFGQHGKLLPILCQPDKIREPVSIPPDIFFMGIDSGVRHSVGGASYGDVRCAAFMGYSIILQSLGITKNQIEGAKRIQDFSTLPFKGYLCNIGTEEFDRQFLSGLPAQLTGKEFIERFGKTVDSVTSVNEDTTYAVRQCAAHPVYEHARVNRFLQLIHALGTSSILKEKQLEELGNLMYQSHESYSRCGLGSERTDEIVNELKLLRREGVYGGKITGGGSGGTVCALAGGEQGKAAVKALHQRLMKKYNTDLVLFE